MPGSLCGYVVRTGTSEPVIGAAVAGSGQPPRPGSANSWASSPWLAPRVSGLTDSAGRFMFEDLRQGDWLLQVQGVAGETLGKAVVHVLNNALSEVTIEVSGSAREPRPHWPQRSREPVPARPPARAPYRPGMDDPYASLDSDGPPAPAPVTMMGSLRGRVTRAADGRPVADATITIVSGAGRAPDMAPITNEDGWFFWDDLPSGRWRLRATAPDGEVGEGVVEVLEGALTEMAIEVDGWPRRGREPSEEPSRRGRLTGDVRGWVVRADTGEPVPGCAMDALGNAGRLEIGNPDSDETGWFDFQGALFAGDWLITATAPGGARGETPVHVTPGGEVEITVAIEGPARLGQSGSSGRARARLRDKAGLVRGRVVRASDGEPFGEATISVVSGPGPAPDIAPLTDREGWFALEDLPSGTWLLRATGPGGEFGEATVDVPAGGGFAEVTIEIRERRETRRPNRRPPARPAQNGRKRAMTGSIRGQVLRADTGRPMADVAITIAGGPGPAPDIAPLSGKDGRFVLDGLGPGEWRLRAAGPGGMAGEAAVKVAAGASSEVAIRLGPAKLRGRRAK